MQKQWTLYGVMLALSLGIALPVSAQSTSAGEVPLQELTQTQADEAAPKTKFSLSADQEALKLTDDLETAKAQVAAHPGDPEAHFLLCAAYSRTPYLEQAFKELKTTKALLKEKQDFEFIDRTTATYEDMLKKEPGNSLVLYRLGLAYFLKGYSIEKYPHHFKNGPTGTAPEFYKKAEDSMKQVISLNPKDTAARNYLGMIMSDNGRDLSRAIQVWQESIKVDSETNPGAYLLLSQAYLKQGDLQNAMLYGAKGLEIKQRMGMTLP